MSKKEDREDRLWSRREAFIKAAYATFVTTGVLVPGVAFAATYTQTPGLEIGPYYTDATNNRSNLKANTSSATAAPAAGLPMNLALSVSRLANNVVTPIANARVDVWNAAWNGHYSGFQAEGTLGQDFLRGYQLTDKAGAVAFATYFPGWYSGRTPHIHARVRLYSGTTATYDFIGQVFPIEAITAQVYAQAPYSTRPGPDTTQAKDRVFTGASQGVGLKVTSNAGQYCITKMAKGSTAVTASFNIVLVY